MNKKGLFLMGLAAMAFASCSNDDLLSDGSKTTGPVVTGEGEPTYVTFNLNVNGGAKTRASHADGNYMISVGRAENVAINKAYLLVYNESSKVLEDTFLIDGKQGLTVTKLVKAGKKRIYVIANPTAGMETKLKAMKLNDSGSTLDIFLAEKFKAETSTGLGDLLSSPMPMSTPDDMSVRCELQPSISEANAPTTNKVTLKLKRMVAKTKIILGDGAKATKKKAGISSDSTVNKYTVRNHSKETYLVQNVSSGIVKSPTYDLKLSDYTNTTNPVTYKFGDYFLMDGLPTARLDSLLYITENTSFSFYKGAAPYIILHTRYRPVKIVTSASYDEYTKTIAWEFDEDVSDADVQQMVIADSTSTGLIEVGTCFKNETVFDNAVAAAKMIKSDFKATSTDYSNGSYYRINLGKKEGESTLYGTERNNSYNVTINSVTGPGWNTLDKVVEEPSDPLDQRTYVNVDISVEPWKDIEQDVDLN